MKPITTEMIEEVHREIGQSLSPIHLEELEGWVEAKVLGLVKQFLLKLMDT